MIDRLLRLQLKDYRSVAGSVDIPLNADVVIIYGQNGSGKTGILSAIELAVTGYVADLARYSEDYPRCLVNFESSSRAHSIVDMVDDEIGEIRQTASVTTSDESINLRFVPVLNERARRSFSDRCYLSQPRLSRLLELYQAKDDENLHTPLVHFVWELLGIDLLENLAVGLYDAEDVRRLQKGTMLIGQLESSYTTLASHLEQLQRARRDLTAEYGERVDRLNQLAADLLPDVRKASPDESAIAVADRFTYQLASRNSSQQLTSNNFLLTRVVAALDTYSRDVETAIDVSPSDHMVADTLPAEIFSAGSQVAEPVAAAESLLIAMGPPTQLVATEDDIASRYDAVRKRLSVVAATMRNHLRERESVVLQAAEIDYRLEQNRSELQLLGPTSNEDPSSIQRLSAILRELTSLISDNVCPVCGRDATEIHNDLADIIRQRIKALSERLSSLEVLETKRGQLVARIADDESLSEALRARLAANRPGAENADRFLADIESHLSDLEMIGQRVERLRELQQRHSAEIRMHTARQERELRRTGTYNDLAAVSRELGNDAPAPTVDIAKFGESLRERLTNDISRIRSRREMEAELVTQVDDLLATSKQLLENEARLKEVGTQFEEAKARRGSIQAKIQHAKRLFSAATDAKMQLLEQVFDNTLNSLWQEIFSRLAPNERARPALLRPVATRGRLSAGMGAYVDSIPPFQQVAAILSSGNLNTAALSLFLALNAIERPINRPLILDDPVQSMDDVHAVNLAALLRFLINGSGRQLVLAVHERNLYDYLTLELGPTAPGRSMITLEVEKKANATTIKHEQRIWHEDPVTVALAAG